jgi:hypothetical protein
MRHQEAVMHVFLCWSGERSHHVAEALEEFLLNLNKTLPSGQSQAFTTFRSQNIEKGLLWFQAVEQQLRDADAALLAITPENCSSPWMHYEAGAIANRFLEKDAQAQSNPDSLKARLFTYLFAMEPQDLQGPLAAYQSTTATYDDTRALVRQLLNLAGAVLPADPRDPASIKWEQGFRQCWNNFAGRLRPYRTQQFCDVIGNLEQKFLRLTFQEPIAQCHRQAWTDRIKACNEVHSDLSRHLQTVKERCRPFEVELYQQLMTALDGYEMSMQAYLVNEVTFPLGKHGKITMPEDVEWVCEHRHVVLDAVAALLDPKRAPLFDESPVFARLETLAEKKNTIHRKTAAIRQWIKQQKEDSVTETKPPSCREVTTPAPLRDGNIAQWNLSLVLPPPPDFENVSISSWDFDRVIYYYTHSESLRQNLSREIATQHGIVLGKELEKKLLDCLGAELERIRAGQQPAKDLSRGMPAQDSDVAVESDFPPANAENEIHDLVSRIPLSYALRVLEDLVQERSASTGGVTHGLDPVVAEKFAEILTDIVNVEQGIISQVRPRAEVLRKKLRKETAVAA